MHSTGVTGLTATLASGTYTTATGNVIFTVTGTPSAAGTATFSIAYGSSNCSYTITVIPPYLPNSNIVMNEIYARGTTADPDWIEIYNKSNAAIDISGYKIYDSGGDAGTKPKKEFPTGSIVSANGFLVIVVDDTAASGFGLSASGEKVWMENASSQLIDTITYAAHTAVQSYGRIPNGGNWQLLDSITRNASNVAGGTVLLYSCATGTTTGTAIAGTAVSGLSFSIPYSNATVGATYATQIIASTGVTGLTATLTSGTYATATGNVNLYGNRYSISCRYSYPSLLCTEASSCSYAITVLPPYLPNSNIVMNEIYARGTTTDPDWIEIYNKSNAAIDISGYKIYDSGGDAGTKPKKEFPTGSIVCCKRIFGNCCR